MQPQNPSITPEAGSSKSWLITLLIVIVVAGLAGAGVYYWQHQKVSSLQSDLNAAKSTPQTTPAPQVAKNVSQSSPLAIPHTKVTLTLTLPAGTNIIQTESVKGAQLTLAEFYTETYNDLLATWHFTTKGSSANPSSPLDSLDQINVAAMGQWLQTNDAAGTKYADGTNAMTMAQKTTYVANLKSTTTTCAKDSAKGFTTTDGKFNICYTLAHPQSVGADWGITLSGYSEINSSPIYLWGNLTLPNSGTQYQPVLDTYIKALKAFTMVSSTTS